MARKVLSLLCVFALMTVMGCQDAAKKPSTPQEPKKAENKQLTSSERRTMAYRSATLAKSVDGVKNATVIVNSFGISDNLAPNSEENPGNIGAPENVPAQKNQGANIDKNNSNKAKMEKRADKDGIIVIIGLDLDKKISDNSNKRKVVKKKVIKKIRDSDTRISQVIVMPDSTTLKSINNIMASVIAGKSIPKLENDLRELNTRLKKQPPVFE